MKQKNVIFLSGLDPVDRWFDGGFVEEAPSKSSQYDPCPVCGPSGKTTKYQPSSICPSLKYVKYINNMGQSCENRGL